MPVSFSGVRRQIDIILKHIHSPSLETAEVNVVANAVGGTLGVFSNDLLAAGAVTEEFDLHFLNVKAFSATDSFLVVFYYDDGVGGPVSECGRARVTRTAAVDSLSGRPILTGEQPHGRIPAGSRIRAKTASDGGGGNIDITAEYHDY